jgi:hypothetical protein
MRGLAVAGFWVLDFGLNGVQASLRVRCFWFGGEGGGGKKLIQVDG